MSSAAKSEIWLPVFKCQICNYAQSYGLGCPEAAPDLWMGAKINSKETLADNSQILHTQQKSIHLSIMWWQIDIPYVYHKIYFYTLFFLEVVPAEIILESAHYKNCSGPLWFLTLRTFQNQEQVKVAQWRPETCVSWMMSNVSGQHVRLFCDWLFDPKADKAPAHLYQV